MINFPDFMNSVRVFLCQSQEAVARRCSAKKLFQKISQNSKENTCAEVSFSIKLMALGLQRFCAVTSSRCFHVNFAKVFRKFLV